MGKRVQAEQVFKYYGLPKWKVVELHGRWENVVTMREVTKGRDSPVEQGATKGEQ